jgi:nitrous oxidase accessory protein NosD
MAIAAFTPALVCAATIPANCTGTGTPVQNAVNAAQPGDVVAVSGDCVESVLVRNEKQRVVIDGGGSATVTAPPGGNPAFNVRGKGIAVRNFANIEANGNYVIHVNRGSNAVIHNNNTIQGPSGSIGVRVDQLAFAIITGNTISGNNTSIWVAEQSSARIGYDTFGTPLPNTLQPYGYGVIVGDHSTAMIQYNTIRDGLAHGVSVERASYAGIYSNDISGNGNGGVQVYGGSGVTLSGNTSTTSNGSYGLLCRVGGYVSGSLDQLNGTLGGKSITAGCVDDL